MNKTRKFLYFFLITAILAVCFTGCGKGNGNTAATEPPEDTTFSYSKGIEDNGYLKGIRALDYVELFDYKAFSIPNDIHNISDETLQTEIDGLLSDYSDKGDKIKDRAVANGDTVNIDYVGSVDGVEFDGGSTGGAGDDVIIGVTNFIDDFLEQLIGHMPGETINVEVTFPDEYSQSPDLEGKEAVFVTTINHILELNLTDTFVETNLSETYSWKTVAEMKDDMRNRLQTNSIKNHIYEYMITKVTVKSVPASLTEYQEKAMLNEYEGYATQYGMELDEFLLAYVGVDSKEALIAQQSEGNLKNSKYNLICQAIAEDLDLSVSDEDITNFFIKETGSSDYSAAEKQYGLPFIKQVILYNKVMEYIVDEAVLE